MDHAMGLITNIAVFSALTLVIIAVSISEAREKRRKTVQRTEAIEARKIA